MNSNVTNIDPDQTPIYVIDDGVWCEGFLVSEDANAPEVHVRYTNRHGSVIEDCIPNGRDNIRIKLPDGSGNMVARPEPEPGNFDVLELEGICPDPRGKDHLYWAAIGGLDV